jgi:hypothetical protein
MANTKFGDSIGGATGSRAFGGTSHSLNVQPGQGTQKPVCSSGEGEYAPPKPADGPVPMPK